MKPSAASLLLSVSLASIACGNPFGVEPDELPLVRTKPSYVLPDPAVSESLTVPFELINSTNRVLYARFSCEVVLERFDSGSWVHYWGGEECLLALEEASYLAPGEPYRGEISPRIDSTWGPGEYRLRLNAVSSDIDGGGFGELGPNIPLELRTSNVFRIEASD